MCAFRDGSPVERSQRSPHGIGAVDNPLRELIEVLKHAKRELTLIEGGLGDRIVRVTAALRLSGYILA
jgi:hypothetical protein